MQSVLKFLFSKDILSRWTFPLVPDNNYPTGRVYEHVRGNKYIPKDDTVVLSRSVFRPTDADPLS
jgi:hypothetical protein